MNSLYGSELDSMQACSNTGLYHAHGVAAYNHDSPALTLKWKSVSFGERLPTSDEAIDALDSAFLADALLEDGNSRLMVAAAVIVRHCFRRRHDDRSLNAGIGAVRLEHIASIAVLCPGTEVQEIHAEAFPRRPLPQASMPPARRRDVYFPYPCVEAELMPVVGLAESNRGGVTVAVSLIQQIENLHIVRREPVPPPEVREGPIAV